MTFDQWVDEVDAQLHGQLGSSVRTAELSWDSAVWVGRNETAIAEQADENAVRLSFGNGETVALPLARPEHAGREIAGRLVGR